MTFDQLIVELFVNHWFFTTFVFPPITFAYAWITDQTAWWACSLFWWIACVVVGKVK